MGLSLFGRKETFGRAEEIAGQSVVAMDTLFLRYLASVMGRAWRKSDDEIVLAVRGHAQKLANPDPERAWAYRMAVVEEAARDWPFEANHDFGLELQREWAPSAADAEQWASLPAPVRTSYMRQGKLVVGAATRGSSGAA